MATSIISIYDDFCKASPFFPSCEPILKVYLGPHGPEDKPPCVLGMASPHLKRFSDLLLQEVSLPYEIRLS